MELRSGFVPPFPGTHALFLSDAELEDLKYLSASCRFNKPSNERVAKALCDIFNTQYGSRFGG